MEKNAESYFDPVLNIKHEPEEVIIDIIDELTPADCSDENPGLESADNRPQNRKYLKRQYSKKNTHSCDFCQRSYSSKSGLTRHRLTNCENGNLTVAQKKTADRGILGGTCRFCQKYFFNLRAHETITHSRIIYSCDSCEFSTKYIRNLEAHKNSIHLKNERFVCSVCLKAFKDQSNRNRHEREVHKTSKTKFSCHICPAAFSRKDNITLHLKRVHGIVSQSVVNPTLHCDLCESTYATKIGLTKHMQFAHLPASVKKRFQCRVCAMEFKLKDSLINHLESIHLKKFCCHICDKVLGSEKSLKTHETKCSNRRKLY